MSKTKTIHTELVPSSSPSLPSVKNPDRADRILAFHHGSKRSAAQQLVYAFLAGVELNNQKEEIAHGKFMKWCEENLTDLPHRTATRYMALADALQPKLATVANIDLPRLQLTNGEIKEDQIEPVSEALRAATNGADLTELYRSYGLIPDKKEKKYSPPAELTPEEEEESKNAAAEQAARDLINQLLTWRDDSTLRARIQPALRRELIEACVQVSNQERIAQRANKVQRKDAKARKAAKKKGAGK